MLVDIMELKRIDPIRWHFLPDSNSGSIPKEAYRLTDDVVCIMHKQPTTVSKDDMISIEWAASVFRKDTSPHKNKRQTAPRAMDGYSLVLSVSIERDDLRSLAETAGTKLRELQEEYGTRGYFGPLRGKIYTADEYEDLGPCEEYRTIDEAHQFLLDTVCDTLDIVQEPIRTEVSI